MKFAPRRYEMRRLEEEQHEALFFFYSLKERRKQRNKEEQKKQRNPFIHRLALSTLRGGLHKVYEFAMSLDIKRERKLHYFFMYAR